MKKVLFAILAFTFIFGVKAMSSASSDSHQLILVKSTSGSVGNPRTLVPIVASVDDETYMLEATFLTDIGMVDVLIQEQSSGASTYRCVDSADGSASISLPAMSGCFIVTFTTEGGDVYEGSFVL